MDVAVEHVLRDLDIRHIKQRPVGAALEFPAQPLAYGRCRAVGPYHEPGGARLGLAIGAAQRGGDLVALVFGVQQLGVAFDGQAARGKLIAQEGLVMVLRKDQQIGIGGYVAAKVAHVDLRASFAARPHVDHAAGVSGGCHSIGHPQLTVQLKRAGMYHHRPRCRARRTGLVDDADADPLGLQPKRQNQTRWTSTDNQNICFLHIKRLSIRSTCAPFAPVSTQQTCKSPPHFCDGPILADP